MKGMEPYIFISYSHQDSEQVLPILDAVCKQNYRIWFDGMIPVGEQWTDELARKIAHCALFMPFLSSAYDASPRCMQELHFADHKHRTPVPVRLKREPLSDELEYLLQQYQKIILSHHDTPQTFTARLNHEAIFQCCRAVVAPPSRSQLASIVTAEPPAGPSPRFVGRVEKMAEIEALFRDGVNVVDLFGTGGIGKSEICRKLFREYTHDSAPYKEVGWVLWKGTLQDTFYGQFVDIQEENADQYWRIVQREFLSRKNLLIVLDNADDLGEADATRLNGMGCHFLVTSRKKIDLFHPVPAGTLTPEECRILYRREWKQDNALTDESSDTALDELLSLAAYHTLAVQLLARTQRASGRSTSELLLELRKSGFDLTNIEEEISYIHRPELRDGEAAEQRFIEHMSRIFDLSVLGEGKRREEAIEVLQGMSLLATNVYIKENMVKKWLNLKNLNGLNRVINSGWLNVREEPEGGRSVAMHPVVAAVVRHTERPTIELVDTVAGLLSKDMIVTVTEIFTEKLPVLEHALAVDNVGQSLSINSESYAEMLYQIGVILNGSSAYNTALMYLQRAARIRESMHYDMNIETAATYNEIGFVYRQLRNYQSALIWFWKSLRIRERVLGLNNVDTSQTLNNIAIIYYYQGRYEKSLKFYMSVLEIREALLGTKHPLTAFVYNSIGNVYYRMEAHEKALEYHQKALDIWKETVDSDHPDIAFSYNNIGRVYAAQGKYERALELLNEAFTIRKSRLGLEHHDTVQTLLDIGEVYYKQHNYTMALKWLKEAESIGSTVLGVEHPLSKSAQEKIETIRLISTGNTENNTEK